MDRFTDSQIVNASGERSVVNVARAVSWRSVARSVVLSSVVLLLALGLMACTAALQVLFIGGADTLGFMPQVSFLSLNLVLIALFSRLALSEIDLRLKRGPRRKFAPAKAKATSAHVFSLAVTSPPRQVCKVLVIRRLGQNVRGEPRASWPAFVERRKSREAALDA